MDSVLLKCQCLELSDIILLRVQGRNTSWIKLFLIQLLLLTLLYSVPLESTFLLLDIDLFLVELRNSVVHVDEIDVDLAF